MGRAVRAALLIVLTRRRMEELTAAAGYTLVWYEEVDRVWRVTAGHHTTAA